MTRNVVQTGDRIADPYFSTPIDNDDNPKISVIVQIKNEVRTISRVISEAGKVHPKTEVIVVDNGSTDGTAEIAERMRARVIRNTTALGYGVGRSIGAKAARGDIILFTDGDCIIEADQLIPFVKAIERGVDVALNQYEGRQMPNVVNRVALSKRVLNSMLSLSWLGAASMTTIPHALSRKALQVIGYEPLAVPPKAQAIAAWSGLLIETAHYLDVDTINSKRRKSPDPLVDLIIGDHLEAIHWLLHQAGDSRAKRPDLGRQRERVRD